MSDRSHTHKETAEVSEDGVREVLSQLVRLGFFHDHEDQGCTKSSPIDTDDDIEAFRVWKSSRSARTDSTWDGSCCVIPTLSQETYYTQKGLVMEITRRLDENHEGRSTISTLCLELGIDCDTVFLSTLPKQSAGNDSTRGIGASTVWNLFPASIKVLPHGSQVELLSDAYWRRVNNSVTCQVKERGRIQVLDLASQFTLPLDVFFANVVSILPGTIKYDADTQSLVSDKHLEMLRNAVLDYFQNLIEPTQIMTVCQSNAWSFEQVLEWLQMDRGFAEHVSGEVHVDDNSPHTAIYVPLAYSRKQEHDVRDFLQMNAFITADHVASRHMLKKLIQKDFTDSVVIGDYDIVIMDRILDEVNDAVQDYCTSTGSEILDLKDYLPAELMLPSVISMILNKIGFSDDLGVAVSVDGQAVIIRRNLIKEIEEKQLPQLIQEFAKDAAQELCNEICSEDEDLNSPTNNAKGGIAKSKRGRGTKKKKASQVTKSGVSLVPLSSVVATVICAFSVFDNNEDADFESIRWEEDFDEENKSLVVAFCRKAFYTASFQKKCEQAVNAEVNRLQSEKNSMAKLSRKDAAAKIRSVEAAFEETFVTLCYLLQAQAKFINVASSLEAFDEDAMCTLRNEFLTGPCADFTGRITQHCLFRDDQDSLFTFIHPNDVRAPNNGDSDPFGLPPYCSNINTALRRYPRTYLSCPPPRDPLPALRDSFSGSVGITLSRQWILCGGHCYRGGFVRVEDDEDGDDQVFHTRPGNIDGFLSHVEENCLTLCGLPFKKLDKKAEKNFLFSRKNEICRELSSATDPEIILELTIMVLFQQVRGLVVSGSLLRGPILLALSAERKVPASVAAALKTFDDALATNGLAASDDSFLGLIKDCGTCRDIAKHDTRPLEEYLAKLSTS